MTETQCRRCSECKGMSHHWLDNPSFGDDDANADEDQPDAEFVCKHCPATGKECEACDGAGYDRDYDPDVAAQHDLEPCPICNGEGVVQTSKESTP